MEKKDVLNQGFFFGFKIGLSTLLNKKFGIPSKLKILKEGSFESNYEFNIFLNDFKKEIIKLENYRIEIKKIMLNEKNNLLYNINLISQIYKLLSEILELLKKVSDNKVNSKLPMETIVSHQFEAQNLELALEKCNQLKKLKMLKILNIKFAKTKHFLNSFNPKYWS